MKRTICLIALLALLLSGCGSAFSESANSVDFYYLRIRKTQDQLQTYFSEGVIGTETRDISGHREDLNYLLTMYLRGPLDSDLKSPFPAGCSLIDVHVENREMSVFLSSGASLLDDLDLNVACACLAQTCLNLAEVDSVHIESRSTGNHILFSTTFTAADLLLEVTPPTAATAEETQHGRNS